MRKLIFYLVFMCVTIPVFAQVKNINATGLDLLKGAKLIIRANEGVELDTDDAIFASYYNGYMQAFNDLVSIQMATNQTYCLPDQGISSEQIAYIARKYLEQEPDKLHFPGFIPLFYALQEVYPC